MMTQHEPADRFIFWCTSPFLVAFICLMPFLVENRSPAAVFTLISLEVCAISLLLGLYDASRFWWALRVVGGLVFFAYVAYVGIMLLAKMGQLKLGPDAPTSALSAVGGLLVFGLPGLCFAIFGRLTWKPEEHFYEECMDDGEESNDDDA